MRSPTVALGLSFEMKPESASVSHELAAKPTALLLIARQGSFETDIASVEGICKALRVERCLGYSCDCVRSGNESRIPQQRDPAKYHPR